MKSFVVSRRPFDQFMKIWRWCEEVFGKPDVFATWDGDFADQTDDWVRFKFYRDEMASAFILQWNDFCISREEQASLGIMSWQDYANETVQKRCTV